jgi:hypothetical protein
MLESELEHLTKYCSPHNHLKINALSVRPEPVEGLNGYMPTIKDVHGSTSSPRTSLFRGYKKMLNALRNGIKKKVAGASGKYRTRQDEQ